MHALPLLNSCKFVPAAPQTAAGTSVVTGATIDCIDAQSVLFIAILGTVTATGTGVAKIQHGDVSDASDMADISGLSVSWTATDDDDNLLLEHTKITKRYHRIVLTPATANSVIGGAVAVLHGMRKQPITQAATSITDYD